MTDDPPAEPAVDIETADDPEDARSIITGMSISVEEQVQPEKFEPFTVFQSLRVTFSPPIDGSDPSGRVEARKRGLQMHRELQNDLETAIENRLSDPQFEHWPDGTEPSDLER